jgi:hypothetical protein
MACDLRADRFKLNLYINKFLEYNKSVTVKKMRKPFFKKTILWVVPALGIFYSSYALSHRFLHDRMPFNCHQIGCMAGEPDEVADNCRCGEVDILELPCKGKTECSPPETGECAEGRYCKAFLPECINKKDCEDIPLETLPEKILNDPPPLDR